MRLDSDKLKQGFFLLVLFTLGVFLFWMLKGFLSAFLGATMLCQPLLYLIERGKEMECCSGKAFL